MNVNPEMWVFPDLNQQSRTLKDRLLPSNIKSYIINRYRQITKPKIVKIDGIKIFVSDNIQGDILRTIYTETYEGSELRIIKSQLEPDDIVMELGTGIGFISSYCAKQIGSERVFTFEANPQLESDIFRNYKLNNVAPNLEMCILGEQSGEQTFYLQKDYWTSSAMLTSSYHQQIQVQVKSFNEAIAQIKPTFLIVDIEGGEYDLFKYSDLSNVNKICVELHYDVLGKEKTKFILSKLADWGFLLDEVVSLKQELFLFKV